MSVPSVAAIAKVVEGFEVGVFVRNTDGDGSSGWALRALPYIVALAELSRATETAPASRETAGAVAGHSEPLAGPL